MADTQTELSILLTAQDQTQGAITNLQKEIASLTVQLQQMEATGAGGSEEYEAAFQRMTTATNELKAAQSDLKNINAGLAASGADTTAQAETGALSFGKLTGAFTLGTLAAGAISNGIQMVKSTIADSITTAIQYQQQMQGLIVLGEEFGQSADQMTTAVQHLTQDGLMNTAQAAIALREVMQKGLDVNQAELLVHEFENIAAFGRKGFEDLGTAADQMANGFRNGYIRTLEMNGVIVKAQEAQQQFAAANNESTKALDDHTKTMAFYNSIVKQGSAEEGNLAAYAQTAAGQHDILANSVKNAQAQLGDALVPSVVLAQRAFVDLMTSMTGSAQGMQIMQADLATLTNFVIEMVDEVVAGARLIVGAFQSITSGSLKPLQDAAKEGLKTLVVANQEYSDQIARIADGTAASQLKTLKDNLDNMNAANNAAKDKVLNRIADENQAYQEAQAQRLQSFNDSLQQMIQAHEDKVTQIKSQMADETASYNEAVAQRQDAYNEQVSSLEDAHAQKVADITQQITDEKSKGLVVDGILFQEANQKKLDKLQDDLDKENTKYAQQLAKLKDHYDDQVQKAKEAYDKKQAALQESLDKESKILQLHAAEVAQMGERTNEDDISRLERKYQEENQKADQQHQNRLAKIHQQANEQGVTFGNAYAAGLRSSDPQIQKVFDEFQRQMQETMNQAGQASANNAWNSFKDNLRRQLEHENIHSGGDFLNWVFKPLTDVGESIGHFLHIPGFASGTNFAPGGMALVGENGPELVNLPRGSQVTPAEQTKRQMNGVHIENFYSYSQADLSGFATELAWRLR